MRFLSRMWLLAAAGLCFNSVSTAASEGLSWDVENPKVLLQVKAVDLETRKPVQCLYLTSLTLRAKPAYCEELERPNLEPACRNTYLVDHQETQSLHKNFVYGEQLSRNLRKELKINLKKADADVDETLDNILATIGLGISGGTFGGAYFGLPGALITSGLIATGAIAIAGIQAGIREYDIRTGTLPEQLKAFGLRLVDGSQDLVPPQNEDGVHLSPLVGVEEATYRSVLNLELPAIEVKCPKL